MTYQEACRFLRDNNFHQIDAITLGELFGMKTASPEDKVIFKFEHRATGVRCSVRKGDDNAEAVKKAMHDVQLAKALGSCP